MNIDELDFHDNGPYFYTLPLGRVLPTDGERKPAKCEQDIWRAYQALAADPCSTNFRNRRRYLENVLYFVTRQEVEPWERLLSFEMSDDGKQRLRVELANVVRELGRGDKKIRWLRGYESLFRLVDRLLALRMIVLGTYPGPDQLIDKFFEDADGIPFFEEPFDIDYEQRDCMIWGGTQGQLAELICELAEHQLIQWNRTSPYVGITRMFVDESGKSYNNHHLSDAYSRERLRRTGREARGLDGDYHHRPRKNPSPRAIEILDELFPSEGFQ